MEASYFDPVSEQTIKIETTEQGIPLLVEKIMSLSSLRGHPALELKRGESYLSLATDGKRASLVFINSLGESFHSIGKQGDEDADPLIYDYFGSWSEVPASWLVGMDEAMECIEVFARVGSADTEKVLLEPE